MSLYAAIYSLALRAYFVAIRIAALFNDKARLFVAGRQGLTVRMRQEMATEKRPCIWMHCASLGEFEQGRPVLEALKEQYPGYAIVLTFFSPSGYEVRKNYSGADHIFYLPMDSNSNANQFLDIVNPVLCIFVKYELWYFYLTSVAARKIPVLLISSVFNRTQGFFKWYGGLQRRMLQCFSHIFVQDASSEQLLKNIGINEVTICGDTRFDRVIRAAQQVPELQLAAAFADGQRVLVAGSTWKEDEVFLQKSLAILPAGWKMILVPHEVNSDHITAIEKLFAGDTIKWSDVSAAAGVDVMNDKKVLLVDKVGFLLQLYKYGNAAWIGGGFGKEGVHNVLEAAVYGIPCFYGPIFHQFIEAKELIDRGGALSVTDPVLFVAAMEQHRLSGTAAKEYVLSNGGATEGIMRYLGKMLS